MLAVDGIAALGTVDHDGEDMTFALHVNGHHDSHPIKKQYTLIPERLRATGTVALLGRTAAREAGSVRVLITGCSRGIGRAAVLLLAGDGHEVIATARRLADLDGLPCAERLAMDVSDGDSVRAAVARAGRVDALVNNAGVGVRGPIETITPHALQAAYDVNVFGMLRVIQAVLPQMRERGAGRIVTVSSVAGRRSMPLVGHYAAMKHAVEAMCEALRYELVPWHICVSLVEPAGVQTDFSRRRISGDATADVHDAYREVIDAVERHAVQTSGGSASAEEIARAIRDALRAEDPPLRIAPTEQARQMITQRAAMSDADWESALVDTIGLRTLPAHAGATGPAR
jgi:NAD(P)-dependent dehydrogenase (short-subunit alcohol dehydrogenase family)